MRVAAVDLGTNSFLCLICDVNEGGGLKVIADVCRVVRLGEKVHQNGFFLPEALARAETVFKEFEFLIKKYEVEKTIATATSAARDVKNGSEFIALGARYGLPVAIIPGDREAILSFEGALSGLDGQELLKQKVLVVDVGGGSTELILHVPGVPKPLAQSFDVGCVRLTEMFLKKDPVESDELSGLSLFAAKAFLNSKFADSRPDKVIAVAGTPTALACIDQKLDFDRGRVDGYIFERERLRKITCELSAVRLSERKKIKGLEPLRADVIVAGGALLLAVLDAANASALTVSTRGLRYGAALHHKEFHV